MNWRVPKIWDGGDVWIIGGGPSLVKQFGIPDDVVDAIKSKLSPPDSYSPYMEFLHNKHTIAINVAFLFGPWVDIVFFGDNSFFLENERALAQFEGLKVSCTNNTTDVRWVKHLGRDGEKPRGITSDPTKVSWNQNSGAAAISLAAHTGARRIFLLGFDMKSTNNASHWHTLYQPKNKERRTIVTTPYERHLRGFPDIAKDAKRLGIEIFNVCPDSAIECFPKIALNNLL